MNRVAIRSTLNSGKVTVMAMRAGLDPAKVEIESKPVEIVGGLSENNSDAAVQK